MTERVRQRVILAVCCAGMTTLSFATAGPAVCLLAIAGDLGMDHAQRGVFLSTAFWGMALGLLLAGPIADRLGFRRVLPVSAVLQAGGLYLISSAQGQWQLLAGGTVLGIGSGVADALFTPLACAVYPGRRTRITNVIHTFFPIGVVLTISAILVLIHWGWTWRAIFAGLAVLALPHGLSVLFLPLPRKAHQGSRRLTAREMLQRSAFLLMLGMIFLTCVIQTGPALWLPNFIEEVTGASRAAGAIGMMLFAMTMIGGRLIAPVIVERLGRKLFFVVGSGLCAASLLLAAAPVGTVFTVFWLCVLGFSVAGFVPTILAWAGDSFSQAGASMYSLLLALGCSGSAIGPIVIGLVAEHLGLAGGIAMLAVVPAILIVLMMRLLKSTPLPEAAAPARPAQEQ